MNKLYTVMLITLVAVAQLCHGMDTYTNTYTNPYPDIQVDPSVYIPNPPSYPYVHAGQSVNHNFYPDIVLNTSNGGPQLKPVYEVPVNASNYGTSTAAQQHILSTIRPQGTRQNQRRLVLQSTLLKKCGQLGFIAFLAACIYTLITKYSGTQAEPVVENSTYASTDPETHNPYSPYLNV